MSFNERLKALAERAMREELAAQEKITACDRQIALYQKAEAVAKADLEAAQQRSRDLANRRAIKMAALETLTRQLDEEAQRLGRSP